jgi:hypothetical protein
MGSKVKREENREVKCGYLYGYDEDARYKRRLMAFRIHFLKPQISLIDTDYVF